MSRILAILVMLFCVAPASGDWINLSGAETAPNIAEIYVADDHIRLVLEVYIGDLEHFEPLIPDDWLREGEQSRRPTFAERMDSFARSTFQFVTSDGTPLSAQLVQVEPRLRKDRQSPFAGMMNPFTRQRISEAPADKRVLYAELVYPFAIKPEQMTIVPPMDEAGQARLNMGFILYHKSVPVIDFRYLSGPATLQLDWDDPWYTRFLSFSRGGRRISD